MSEPDPTNPDAMAVPELLPGVSRHRFVRNAIITHRHASTPPLSIDPENENANP